MKPSLCCSCNISPGSSVFLKDFPKVMVGSSCDLPVKPVSSGTFSDRLRHVWSSIHISLGVGLSFSSKQ